MAKTFEKQTKTSEDQGKHQLKRKSKKSQKIRKHDYIDEDSPLISKQKEIFNRTADNRLEEITDLVKRVILDNLTYRYKGPTADVKFDKFNNALILSDEIRERN